MDKVSEAVMAAEVDHRLMQEFANGDPRAFELLYQKYKGGLYRYFIRQIGDKQLAEDLYQETWARVIKAAAGYERRAKFTTWLYRIAHNLLIDHVRALKPVELFSDAAIEGEPINDGQPCMQYAPEQLTAQGQKATILKECIALLPHVQKEAFLLNMEMGFTAVVIAEVAGAGLEAIKSRLRYATQSLKQCVEGKWQEQHNDTK